MIFKTPDSRGIEYTDMLECLAGCRLQGELFTTRSKAFNTIFDEMDTNHSDRIERREFENINNPRTEL